MKNIRLYSLIVAFLLILVSCGNGQTKEQRNKFKNSTAYYSNEKDSILYLDLKAATEKKVDVNLSEICDSVIYIPLQINKNCFVSSGMPTAARSEDYYISIEKEISDFFFQVTNCGIPAKFYYRF
jgi:hypothetical protein